MRKPVFIVSEWLPKEGKEEALWIAFKTLMETTRKEPGCISAHATKQLKHPASLGQSKFTMVMLQEYRDIDAFDAHVQQQYVLDFFKEYIDTEDTLIADWQCRLFEE